MPKIIRLLSIVFAGLTFVTPVISAEIKLDKQFQEIVIEGRIVEGDYERFANAVLDGGTSYDTVMLASKGGDAFEAIKIGKLIRALNFNTRAPQTSPKGSFCYPLSIKPENCTCLSACPLIYLAGVKRSGDVIGVHRIILNQEATKKLSLDESRQISEILSEATRKYLEEMGAPDSLIEKVGASASDKIEMLTPKYVEERLTGYANGYDEWFIARCGSLDQAITKLDNKRNDGEFSKYMKIHECNANELKSEIGRKFWSVMSSAVKAANPSYIPESSNLAFVKKKMPFEMGDIIGRKNTDAMKMLTLSGIGTRPDQEIANLKNANYLFNKMINVGFDKEGRAYRIHFFAKSGFEDYRPYLGYYLNGLTINSKPNDFIKVFGDPVYSGCMKGGGTCRITFDAPRYSVEATFESDKETLWSIAFQVPGYWKSLM